MVPNLSRDESDFRTVLAVEAGTGIAVGLLPGGGNLPPILEDSRFSLTGCPEGPDLFAIASLGLDRSGHLLNYDIFSF